MQAGTKTVNTTYNLLDRNRGIFIASEISRGNNVNLQITRECVHVDPVSNTIVNLNTSDEKQYSVTRDLNTLVSDSLMQAMAPAMAGLPSMPYSQLIQIAAAIIIATTDYYCPLTPEKNPPVKS